MRDAVEDVGGQHHRGLLADPVELTQTVLVSRDDLREQLLIGVHVDKVAIGPHKVHPVPGQVCSRRASTPTAPVLCTCCVATPVWQRATGAPPVQETEDTHP